MANLKISKKIHINDYGEIQVSDLFGKKEYMGVYNPEQSDSSDFILQQVLTKMNPHIKLYSFAEPLKTDICINILGLTYEQCYGSDEDKNSITDLQWGNKQLTARDVMQIVGTDILRKMKPDVWTSALIRKIKSDNPNLAIITDCRFPNEVDCIQDNQGDVIRLTRNTCNSDHSSETILDKTNYEWDNFDYVLDNDNLDIYQQSLSIEKILKEVLS